MNKKSSNEINIDYYGSDQLICPRERANSLSECTTETLLSPSTEAINCKNNMINSNSPPVKVTVPLQPYQGRNPCLARNLMLQQPDDLSINGNSLIDCPSKYSISKKIYSFSDGDTVLSVPSVGVENSFLVNNTNRKCNPIPYVQNQVNSIPKKPNMLENNFSKDFLNKIAGLLVSLNRKKSSSNCYLPEEQQLLKNSTISSPISPSDIDSKQGQINPVDTFWLCNDVKNNDHVINIDKIMKPNDSIPTAELMGNNTITSDADEYFPKTTVDPFWNGNNLEGNKESKNFSMLPNGTDAASKTDKSKRPTTLPVQPLENDLDVEGSFHEESDVDISKEIANDPPPQQEKTKTVVVRRGSKRKGVKRVQTPYEITGRFSLIDDRIMSSQELPSASATNPTHSQFDNVKSSVSVPNMNTLCSSNVATNRMQVEKKEETELEEIQKGKPVNGLIVPVNHYGHQNVLIV